MKYQKVRDRLAVRRRLHDLMVDRAPAGADKAFKRPGSLSGRK